MEDLMRAGLEQKVQEAHQRYLALKEALESYIRAEEGIIQAQMGTDFSRKESAKLRPNLSQLMPKVLEQITPGEIFTTEIFFDKLGLEVDYAKTRPSLSTFLARRVQTGELRKISRREFQRVPVEERSRQQRGKTIREDEEQTENTE